MGNVIFWLVAGIGLIALLDYKDFWFYTQFWLKPLDRRPYTFIFRDFSCGSPLLWGAMCFFGGAWLHTYISYTTMIVFFAGLLAGHLWWNKDYIPHEQEEPPYCPEKVEPHGQNSNL